MLQFPFLSLSYVQYSLFRTGASTSAFGNNINGNFLRMCIIGGVQVMSPICLYSFSEPQELQGLYPASWLPLHLLFPCDPTNKPNHWVSCPSSYSSGLSKLNFASESYSGLKDAFGYLMPLSPCLMFYQDL